MAKTLKHFPLTAGEHLLHITSDSAICNDTVYQDRLWQWDDAKYQEAAKAAGIRGQIWDGATFHDIKKLLDTYFDADITIHRLSWVDVRGYRIHRADVWNPALEGK